MSKTEGTSARSGGRFEQRIAAVAEFRRQFGRLPTKYSDDTAERALALFLQRIRQAERGKSRDIILTDERRGLLDTRLPGWRGRGVRRTREQLIEELTRFVRQHGRYPRSTPGSGEEHLAKFLQRIRTSQDLPEDCTRLLDAQLPDWRNDRGRREQNARVDGKGRQQGGSAPLSSPG
ncbi:hypothetical protein [Microbacterium sp.]|uniref:hypothetical protein n=1 Tax=Microbacterium sp. TaxID=51671 RepID=UPI003F945181